jgi:hypothetical protein
LTITIPAQREIAERRVQDALLLLKHTPGLTAKTAALQIGAHYRRILNRTKVIESMTQRPDSNKKLSNHQEEMLPSYIDRMDRIGTTPLIHQVHDAAQRVPFLHAPEGTKPPTLGRDWTKNFVDRCQVNWLCRFVVSIELSIYTGRE